MPGLDGRKPAIVHHFIKLKHFRYVSVTGSREDNPSRLQPGRAE